MNAKYQPRYEYGFSAKAANIPADAELTLGAATLEDLYVLIAHIGIGPNSLRAEYDEELTAADFRELWNSIADGGRLDTLFTQLTNLRDHGQVEVAS